MQWQVQDIQNKKVFIMLWNICTLYACELHVGWLIDCSRLIYLFYCKCFCFSRKSMNNEYGNQIFPWSQFYILGILYFWQFNCTLGGKQCESSRIFDFLHAYLYNFRFLLSQLIFYFYLCNGEICPTYKRHEEISQVKLLNNLNLYKKYKVHVVWLVFL